MPLLYHCFPRRSTEAQIKVCGYKRTDGDIIGLEILSSLFEHGLLLTPEDLTIPKNPASTRLNPPGPLKLRQRRACFTLLEFEDLFGNPNEAQGTSHAGAFGEFAIGLEPVEARLLGVMPTFYYYHVLQKDLPLPENLPSHAHGRDYSAFGPSSELLFRLAELRSLLVALAHIEAVGAPEGRAVYRTERLLARGYAHDLEPDVTNALCNLSHSTARAIYACLDIDRVPAWNLIEWLDILLNAFQVADSRQSISSLEYYQQREWRIIQLHSPFFDCYPLVSSQTKRLKLATKKIEAVYGIISRHAALQGFQFDPFNTYLLLEAATRPFSSFIREIIVPARVLGHTELILRDAGIDQTKVSQSLSTYGETIYARLILSKGN